MLLYLAVDSLTTHNHLLTNKFIMEHRDTFSLTKKSRDNVSVSFTHKIEFQVKMTLYINVSHCFSYIYGQLLVVHPSEWILPHCCSSLQLNTEKGKKRDRKSKVYNYSNHRPNISVLSKNTAIYIAICKQQFK